MKKRIIKGLFLVTLLIIASVAYSLLSGERVNSIPVEQSASLLQLAEKYKPAVVFDSSSFFYPVRFDEVKQVILEYNKKPIKSLPITAELLASANTVNDPYALFKEEITSTMQLEDVVVYYSSLSNDPTKWEEERVIQDFTDSIPMYVNINKQKEWLKITYTLVFEGNYWNNLHRGDGAMYAIYFENKEGVYQPVKTRAYMHLQYMEKAYTQSIIVCADSSIAPLFFVSPGGHSTYHSPGVYTNVEGVPIMNSKETLRANVWYPPSKVHLIFGGTTRNSIEKWGYEGNVYWGGSPNDRIYSSENWIGKVPLVRSLPLGNRSAKMTNDPSAVFDRKKFKGSLEQSIPFENRCN